VFPQRKQAGGIVGGRGRGDTQPHLLEPGEFVMRRRAVEAVGPDVMGQINRGVVPRTVQRTATPTRTEVIILKVGEHELSRVMRNIAIDGGLST
jgi:hypothetical protein